MGFQKLGPLPEESPKGHSQVSLTPGLGGEGEGVSAGPSLPTDEGTPPGPPGAGTHWKPSSASPLPPAHPLPSCLFIPTPPGQPGRGPGEGGGWAGPWDILFFFYITGCQAKNV